MNKISDQFKQNLYERTHNSPPKPYNSGFTSSQQKFYKHFESINQSFASKNPKNHEEMYMSKLEQYQKEKSTSLIDDIIQENEDNLYQSRDGDIFDSMNKNNPTGLKHRVQDNLNKIQQFFTRQKKQHIRYLSFDDEIMELDGYAKLLLAIEHSKREHNESLPELSARSIRQYPKDEVKEVMVTPVKHIEVKEVEVDTYELEETHKKQQISKIKKADLILMEISREKKRKSLSNDYFIGMELKLMELLDYILQEEDEYLGLDPMQKMKQVLTNLDSFKGKLIDGESKINLLRIFFEQFRNLKSEKQKSSGNLLNSTKKRQKKQQKTKSKSKEKQIKNKFGDTSKISKWNKKVLNSYQIYQGRKGHNEREDQWISEMH